MKFDNYSLKARIYPSIITLIPFILFTMNCNIKGLKILFDNLLSFKIFGNIAISAVLLSLLIQANRFFGKYLFEKNMFKDELEFPTTLLLLHSNNRFSEDYKQKIRQKIKKDFSFDLPEHILEIENLPLAKKQIAESVGLIRGKVRDGRLLLNHNIEYGFARNLIGGAIIAMPVSIFDTIYFFLQGNNNAGWVSLILSLFFLILLFLHRLVIKMLGYQYATRLFQEFLSK